MLVFKCDVSCNSYVLFIFDVLWYLFVSLTIFGTASWIKSKLQTPDDGTIIQKLMDKEPPRRIVDGAFIINGEIYKVIASNKSRK